MKKNFTKKLTQGSVLIALATVLSVLKLLNLPAGGSVTFCSMLPVLLIGYRFGMSFGLLSGFVYGIIQLLLGLDNFAYATSAVAVIAIIFLDYIVPFTVLGLGGIFKKGFKNQTTSLSLGMALVCVLRYICHTISGCTVWAGLAVPTKEALLYSVSYNATYMLPELLIAIVGTVYIAELIDFKGDTLTRRLVPSGEKHTNLNLFGMLVGAATIILDIIFIAPKLQDTESGAFIVKGLANVNWGLVLAVSILGFAVSFILFVLSKKANKKV
jgi:thiamine transporter